MIKNLKIKFFHKNPALLELYPAILGSDHTMDWVKTEREKWNSYNEKTKLDAFSILKCPGIFELYSKGFFIQQPYDISFILKEKGIYVETPDLVSLFDNKQEIIFHTPINTAVMPLRTGTVRCVPNISTGFRMLSKVPLLIIPVPYPDQYEWECSTGILETNKSVEVKMQVQLNNYKEEKEKTWKINAGDNIMFVIPLTSDNWIIENQLTIKEKLWIQAHDIAYSKTNLCPMSTIKNFASYSNILPDIKKRLNDAFKKLWG